MTKSINPRELFALLESELPAGVHEHVVVVGSLAAAYHYADELVEGGVKTKDADLLIHPAGHTIAAREIAMSLFAHGWRERGLSNRAPGTASTPADELPAIRLYPPDHDDYFVELLMVPEGETPGSKPWVSVDLGARGYYGLPGFEFLPLTTVLRQRKGGGIEYAHPAMMALANLLSHQTLSDHVMSSPIGGRTIHRHAKDLGRILALFHLTSDDERDLWHSYWLRALKERFPRRWPTLATGLGNGLRDLLLHSTFEEAWHCCNIGLLAGTNVTELMLRATARGVIADVIEKVEEAGKLQIALPTP